jgi:hypothetical protein
MLFSIRLRIVHTMSKSQVPLLLHQNHDFHLLLGLTALEVAGGPAWVLFCQEHGFYSTILCFGKMMV